MSALTDLFTSMANKIRSKTGTATTYTPTEMVSDGIDDVYDAGYADATTPITPSNSSPASMTSGTGYKPTANGYAISDYDTISLRTGDMPKNLYNGSIYKANADQLYAVKSINAIMPDDVDAPALSRNAPYFIYNSSGYAIESQPQSLTPSDSSPAAISSGGMYRAGGAGYAIESQPSMLSPSNSSPALIISGSYYYAGGSGYAIQSNPTPMNPQQFTAPVAVYNGNFIKLTGDGKLAKSVTTVVPSDNPSQIASGTVVLLDGSGYVYRSPENFKFGTVADKSTASEEFSIDTGLSSISKFIMWGRNRNNDRTPVIIYDPNVIGSNKFSSAGIQTGAAAQRPTATIGDNSTAYNGSIKSISGGTVTIKQATSLDNIFASGIQWVAKP